MTTAVYTIHGYISDHIRKLSPQQEYSKLNPLKKLLFKLLGVVKLETVYVKTPIGTEGEVKVYLARCPNCKQLYIDYPHGYTRFIECPNCHTRIYI